MLNRRILRIKAFKELFVIEMSPEKSLAAAQKELDAALESTRDLYLFMLSSISPLTRIAAEKITQLQMKVNKTEEEKHPNMKFAGNALAQMFDADPDFRKIIRKKALDWGPYDLILRKIYASIQTKDYFQEYMASDSSSLEEDCRLFSHIFEEEFVDREDLETALEDLSIYWNDDLPYSLTWCCRTMDAVARSKRWTLPPLFLSDGHSDMEDDNLFVHKLLREAYTNYDRYFELVSSSVPNWDKDRLVGTDMAIIITGLAEIASFPNIPLKISINEYVEISKYFGTPKSSTFVNGILDALSKRPEFQKVSN